MGFIVRNAGREPVEVHPFVVRKERPAKENIVAVDDGVNLCGGWYVDL